MKPRKSAPLMVPAAPGLAGAVDRDEQADAVVDEEVEVGVEGLGVAAVPDDLVAVAVLVIEAEGHAVEGRVQPWAEAACISATVSSLRMRASPRRAVLEVGDHEPGHVGSGGAQAPGREVGDELIGLRRLGGAEVARGHVGLQGLRQGLAEARVGHAQGGEDVVLDVVGERLARDPLHDVAGQAGAVVGIGGDLARGEDARRRPPRQVRAQGGRPASGR